MGRASGQVQLFRHEHLERIRESGHFRLVQEIALHHIEHGGVERLQNLALSYGITQELLKAGLSPEKTGLVELEHTTRQLLGEQEVPWWWGVAVRFGVK